MNHCLSFITFLLSAVLSVSSSYAVPSSKNVEGLWQEYSKAEQADRPAKQADVLKRIINISFADRLVWDFNEACNKYISVVSSVNWKDYDNVRTQVIQKINEFDEPILIYVNRNLLNLSDDQIRSFLDDNQSKLQKACNSKFYDRSGSPSYITATIQSDYEYVLWSILHDYGLSKQKKDYISMLSDAIGQRYPEAAYLEYYG